MLIRDITVHPEPMGDGYQAFINGNPRHLGRGNTPESAIGNAVMAHVLVDFTGLAEKRELAKKEMCIA